MAAVAKGWRSGPTTPGRLASAPGSVDGFRGRRGLWLSGTWRRPRRLRPVVGRLVAWLRDFLAEIPEHRCDSLYKTPVRCCSLQRVDFLSDVVLVLRQALREIGKLVADQDAQTRYRDEGHNDNSDDRRHTAEMTSAEQQGRRREGKTEEDREGHWHEHVTPEIKRSNCDGADDHGSHHRGRLASGGDPYPTRGDNRIDAHWHDGGPVRLGCNLLKRLNGVAISHRRAHRSVVRTEGVVRRGDAQADQECWNGHRFHSPTTLQPCRGEWPYNGQEP